MSDAVTASPFVAPGEHAQIAIIVVTFNNTDHLAGLLESLRAEAPTFVSA